MNSLFINLTGICATKKTYKPIGILGKWAYHTANGDKHLQDQEKRRGTDMDWNVMVQYLPQYEKRPGSPCVWVWPVSSGPSLWALSAPCSSTKKCRCCAVSWALISSSAGTRRCWSSCSFFITACPRLASRPTPSSAALQALPFWAAATWPRPSAAGWKPSNLSRPKVP